MPALRSRQRSVQRGRIIRFHLVLQTDIRTQKTKRPPAGWTIHPICQGSFFISQQKSRGILELAEKGCSFEASFDKIELFLKGRGIPAEMKEGQAETDRKMCRRIIRWNKRIYQNKSRPDGCNGSNPVYKNIAVLRRKLQIKSGFVSSI